MGETVLLKRGQFVSRGRCVVCVCTFDEFVLRDRGVAFCTIQFGCTSCTYIGIGKSI